MPTHPIKRLAAFAVITTGAVGAHAAPPSDLAMSPVETRVLGPAAWHSGARGALRVIVTDRFTGKPLAGDVRLALMPLDNGNPSGKAIPLASARTDRSGTLNAGFVTPHVKPGSFRLTVAVDTPLGADAVVQNIQMQSASQILLTSDKPVYQPGQTIHLRALALESGSRIPVSGSDVTFEVEDARGNKVFKSHAKLSHFGVAGTDFVLADEVNMGTFHIRAILPDGQAEKTVRVERYVLPKFKVALTTQRTYFLPGETVTGNVDSHYFFGKPVSGAAVDIDVNTTDIGVSKIGHLHGVTGGDGKYQFTFTLPNSFIGQAFEQGKGVVEFAADVRDTANHTEHGNVQVPVVAQPVLLSLIPESESLVPGVDNRVYVAAAKPDGSPLKNATLILSASPSGDNKDAVVKTLRTDALGITTFTFKPQRKPYTVAAQYANFQGLDITASSNLSPIASQDGILLRTSKTFAKVGETIKLAALSTQRNATVYFDVVRDGQTVLTRSDAPNNGASVIELPLTSDMTGTIQIHAYTILPNEDIVRDTRTVIVAPADDLSIAISPNQAQYRPGENATVRLAVTDRNHQPVASAIGLSVVDESVFALSELKPGLERIYFTLEKELMEPRYEIHGLSPVILFDQPLPRIPNDSRQRAGAMLLSPVRNADPFTLNANSYDDRWKKVREAAVKAIQSRRQAIATAVTSYNANHTPHLRVKDGLELLVDAGMLKHADALDPWGNGYKFEGTDDQEVNSYFALRSAGPDGRWDTSDDLTVNQWGEGGRGGFPGGIGGGGFVRGGFGGGGFGGAVDEAMPMVLAAPMMLKDVNRNANSLATNGPAGADQSGPRVREYFPETLFWNPSIITDDRGIADVPLPLADSITTWRVSAMANSAGGMLGSGTAPIKVFQDFFADLDLPVSLTQGDRVDVPVSLYNYLPEDQDVTVTLAADPWFQLDGSPTQHIHLGPNQVSVVYFPISANLIGTHAFLVTARGTKLSDAVKRTVSVLPNGKENRVTVSDRLESAADATVTIPENALPGANNLWIKLYPGTFSQVVEGLDSLLRMPYGCFEQTSSTTYPNVLVLGYLKQTKKINPEIQLKAEQFINIGYQRLVTFECKSGGFSWFGNEPAHQILTAYGLLEFNDMSHVHDVDPNLITRTQNWLAGKQKADGSWEETGQGIAEGIINRQTGSLRTTAYVAWALAESGYTGPEVAKGLAFVRTHASEASDPYTLAVMLNLFTAPGVNAQADASSAADRLIALAKTTDKTAYWVGDTTTFTGAEGAGADIETTALAAFGLLKYRHAGGFVEKVLTYLVQGKDSYGTWSTTQGTVWALKVLLYASANSTEGGAGTVDVTVNGEVVKSIKLTADDSDVMQQIDATAKVHAGVNTVHLAYRGKGSLLYQVVGRYYTPWTSDIVGVSGPQEPLSLKVDYDKTTLALNDTATTTVTIHNNTLRTAQMPLIDVGVPPGFDVNAEKLEDAVKSGQISKFTVTGRQVIIYMEKLDPGATVTLSYQIKARFPIKAATPLSKAYPYYDPTLVSVDTPKQIEVRKTL